MWPFGRSADRFMAPIAQNDPFWAQKCDFLPLNHFFVGILQFFPTFMMEHQIDNGFMFIMMLGKLLGGFKGPFLAQN